MEHAVRARSKATASQWQQLKTRVSSGLPVIQTEPVRANGGFRPASLGRE